MKRSIATALRAAALSAALAAAPALAQTDPAPEIFAVGDWRGEAYRDAGGRVASCGVSLRLEDGLALILSMRADGARQVGLGLPGGGLVPGERLPLSLAVDGAGIYVATAAARDGHVLSAPLDGDDAFQALRRGNRLTVGLAGQTAAFPLKGSAAALDRLVACARGVVASADTATPAALGEAELAALLRTAGVHGAFVATPQGFGPIDHAWITEDGLFGGASHEPRRGDGGLDGYVAAHAAALEARCSAGFAAQTPKTDAVDAYEARFLTTRCGDTVAATLIVAGPAQFDVFFHEGPTADETRVQDATTALFVALRRALTP